MLGYEPGEFPAAYENWSALIHPENRAATEKKVQEHIDLLQADFDVEFRMLARDGGWRWILGRGLSGFIQKPFQFNELRDKLRAVLESSD